MKNKANLLMLVMLLSGSFIFTSCKKDKDDEPQPVLMSKLNVKFDHLAGNKKFHHDSTYVTANGDTFTASLFKYYVSNFRLVKTDNSEYAINNSYFLINQDEVSSRDILMSDIPSGNFKAIKFIIGVDSARNMSGAQTGALDPINGMFWDWNTGYIFLKIEGTSPSVPTMGGAFSYHIGGFKAPNVNYKEIELSFDGDELILANGNDPEVHVVVNVLELFTNPNTIDMTTFGPLVHMPNANAKMVAENYANMFTYDHIHE